MKLTIIGRDPQCASLVLDSEYVSGYHAEIIQLENGQILLVDKSTNGTFVNGMKVTPNTEVPVNRGDNIVFADTPLNWNLIPMQIKPSNVKKIINIGSHRANDIIVQGPNVSRFHATILKKSDGRWYINDHSKNGTSVNGNRIPNGHDISLKPADQLACAGVPFTNPLKGRAIVKISAIAAACLAVCVAVLWGTVSMTGRGGSLHALSDSSICERYDRSVVLMTCSYHFKVECGTLDISELYDPDSFNSRLNRFMRPMYDEFIIEGTSIMKWDGSNSIPFTATGFFIGDKGYLVSCRHVARPWDSEKTSYSENSVTMLRAAEDYYRQQLTKLYEMGVSEALAYVSQIRVTGVMDETVIVPNGYYYDDKSSINCHEVICSDEEQDLSIFKIKSNKLPEEATSVPFSAVNDNRVKTGRHALTIGFPFGLSIQEYRNKQLQATVSAGNISRTDYGTMFGLTAASHYGASGSPVFDDHGNLVGVVNSGISETQGFNFAVRSSYLYDIIEKSGIRQK